MPVDPVMQASLEVAIWIIYVQAAMILELLKER